MRILQLLIVFIFTFFGIIACKTSSPIQPGYSVHKTCDINLFDLAKIEECKKGKISIEYKVDMPTGLDAKMKTWKLHWDIINQDSLYYLVRIDTVHGVFKYQRLYDSIMVFKNRIVFFKREYAPDGNLLDYQVEELFVDSAKLGHYRYMIPPVELSSLEYLKADSGKLGIRHSATVLLKEKQGILTYKNRSLFWHAIDFFNAFYGL